jgi:hypothetical protein
MGLAPAPFFIDTTQGKALAISGLVCLIYQAYRLGALNLVLVNTVSIVGYLYALFIRS